MGDPYRILIVEDDPVVARAVARVLRDRGMCTVAAKNREQAEAAGGGFDAGVFDVDLPDGNGIELARLLLASGAVAVATFHSAETSVETRLEASELGSFCAKGEGIHALYNVLTEALAGHEVAALAVGADGANPLAPGAGRGRTGKRRKLR